MRRDAQLWRTRRRHVSAAVTACALTCGRQRQECRSLRAPAGDVSDIVDALACPAAVADAARASLKLDTRQADVVWDSLLYAAARYGCGAAPSDAEALVQQRVMARELEDAGELSPRPVSTDGDVPKNKVRCPEHQALLRTRHSPAAFP
jgi:hypothetical protein